MFHDHASGLGTTVANTQNFGQMGIQGNHSFGNFVNNGQANVMARAFTPDGRPIPQLMELDEEAEEPTLMELNEEGEVELEDLARFNNFNNLAGGYTQI